LRKQLGFCFARRKVPTAFNGVVRLSQPADNAKVLPWLSHFSKESFMPGAQSLNAAFMVVQSNSLDELRSLVISIMRRYPLAP
jgi:hypothetical protein